MNRTEGIWRVFLNWLADWQVAPVGFLALVLVFPTHYPPIIVSLALTFLPLLWILYRLARGRFFTRTPADIPLLVLLLLLPVGLWVSPLPGVTIPHLIKYLIAVALFYALVNTLAGAPNRIDVPRLAGWVLLLGTASLAAVGLVGMALGNAKLPFLPTDLSLRIPRLITAFWNPGGFHPNIVGGILAMLLPVTAAYLWYAKSWTARLFFLALLLGEAAVLLLTQSRGGMLGFGVALVVVAIASNWRWVWALPAVGLLVAILSSRFDLAELVVGGVGHSAVGSLDKRLDLYLRGVFMMQDFAFTGIGPGMFPRLLSLLYPLFSAGPDSEIPHVHNIYLQMGVDHGFPGLVAFLALLILLGFMGVQAVRASRDRSGEPLAVGLLAGFSAFLVHGMVDATGFTPRAHIMVWGFFGMMAAFWRWVCAVE